MTVEYADERQPLLPERAQRERSAGAASDSEPSSLLDFDPSGDADNPMDWPASFKWGIVTLLAFMAFTVTFTCIGVVPVASRIVQDLSPTKPDKSASVLLVTIWELGEAAGPLFIAPLSEVYGRYPVLNTANALFIAATLLAATSPTVPLFIAARALTGLAVASNVLNPAIVGDMFPSEQRGTAMSAIMLAPLIGGAVGPAISGAVAQTLGWRQVLLLAAGLAGACEILFLTCFRETYKVPILRRRAEKLRRESGDDLVGMRIAAEEAEEGRRWVKLWASVMRPAVVLFGSGVLLVLSVFGSVVFAFFYIMCVSLPDILEDVYHLSPALAGTTFLSFSIGSFVSVALCNRYLDKIYVRLRDLHQGVGRPEFRLPLVVIGAFTLPFAIAAYGWTAQLALPLPLLLFTVSLIGCTLLLAFIPILAYVVDAFGIFSASALTGVIVTRCLMGTFLPLSLGPLVDYFGYGWGITLMGAMALVLAPIPVLIMRYGPTWRQRSKYSREA